MRDRVALRGVNEERNVLLATEGRKADWIGHIMRRNCLLKHTTEGKIERRRSEQIMVEVTANRRHWNLKEKSIDSILRRTAIEKRLWTGR